MDIGIPVEQSPYEYRVGMTPQGVKLLTQVGHRLYIERGAGLNAGFQDSDFERAGATIVYNGAEVYGRANMIAKVGAPTIPELQLLQEGQIVLAFWHLAAQPREVMLALLEKKITAIAYETIQRDDGLLPVLHPLSEIAGRMAPQIAARWLQTDGGGPGLLIGGLAGIPPIDVLILGAGTVGINATKAFLGAGARVFMLDRTLSNLQVIEERFNGQVVTMVSYDFNIARVLKFAHVVVCAALVPGERSPILITHEMLKAMRPQSLIIDIAIDQGGCAETSRPTTHANPVYVEDNVLHYCVPNISSVVARTASHAYLNGMWPYGLALATHGVEAAMSSNAALRRGVVAHQGQIVHDSLVTLYRGS